MQEKYPKEFSEEDAYELWFNGAGDHFFSLEVPECFENTEIGKSAKELQDEALARRLSNKTTEQDFNKFFDKLENLAMLIDKHLGVEDNKAKWN